MGISDLFNAFISTPGKVFNYVQENILKSPRQQKRPRNDSADLELHEHPVARLKLSLPDPGDKADSRRGNLSGNTPQHLLDGRIVSGEVVSPPAHWLQRQQEARGLKRLPGALYSTSPAKRVKPSASASPAQPLQLWSSIRSTRHGPQTGFKRAPTPFMPTVTPALDPVEQNGVRRQILKDLGQAGEANLDLEVKTAQAAAQRAAMLHKLQLRELQSEAGGRTSQPLSKVGTPQDTSRLMGRLAASSTALSKQAITLAMPQTPDQMRQPFFMSATPLGEQQERAMRQVLQEQEDLKLRELEKDRSKAAYQEVKARYRQAEDRLREIRDRAQRVVDGTDPSSTSRRGIQLALARDIKLAEEERRRWEALRERSLLQYAAAQPLPDEAQPAAAAGVPGVLRRTESPGDSASSQLQQQRQGLKPAIPVQARKAPPVTKAVPKPQEEETVVLLSDSEEEEQQDEVEPEEEADEEEEETEEESSLSEALEGVHVGDEVASAARQLSKKQQALAAKALGPGAADEIVAYHRPSNIEMPRRLLRCLRGLDWLNDEVINIYMGMLQVRDGERRKAGLGPRCHFFNSFFVNKLWQDAGSYCYANVARWTHQKKLQKQGQLSNTILEVDRVIMPVHLGNHWTCAVIDLAAKELVYHDSMGGRHMEIMKALRKYVADEYRDKLKQTVDTSKWKIRFPADIPYQTNGSDCGVFALQYAEHASRGAAFDFDQQDMPLLRLKIAADIMSLKII